MTKDELYSLSKRALEDYGRTLDIELDRRLSKPKLIEQVVLAQESFIVNTTTMPVAAVETVVVEEDKYKLVRQGDSWSVSYGTREVYKTSSEIVAKKWMENN